jgi:hypothetical protein
MSEITDKMDEAGYLRQCHEFTENVRDMLGAGYGEGYQLSDLWRILRARDKAFLEYERAEIVRSRTPLVDLAALRAEVIKAIHNPGSWAGAKGDRSREVWQSHAVMFVFAHFVEGKPNPTVDGDPVDNSSGKRG